MSTTNIFREYEFEYELSLKCSERLENLSGFQNILQFFQHILLKLEIFSKVFTDPWKQHKVEYVQGALIRCGKLKIKHDSEYE